MRVYQIPDWCQSQGFIRVEQNLTSTYAAVYLSAVGFTNMTIIIDKKSIRRDKLLRFCMFTGIPLSILAVISLWIGQYAGSPALGMVFVISAALAVTIGLVYNVRFVILSIREVKRQQSSKS